MYYVERYINPFTDFGFKKIFGDVLDIDTIASKIGLSVKQIEELLWNILSHFFY